MFYENGQKSRFFGTPKNVIFWPFSWIFDLLYLNKLNQNFVITFYGDIWAGLYHIMLGCSLKAYLRRHGMCKNHHAETLNFEHFFNFGVPIMCVSVNEMALLCPRDTSGLEYKVLVHVIGQITMCIRKVWSKIPQVGTQDFGHFLMIFQISSVLW